jgi:Clr5 domain
MDHLEAAASSMLPPPQSNETARYTKEEWEQHRAIVEGMYPIKGMHLQGIIEFLKEHRGFVVK